MPRSSGPEVFGKKGALKISQNSQENTYTRATFLIKLQASATLLKKEILAQTFFSVNFAKFLKAPFFQEYLWWLLLDAAKPAVIKRFTK